jgi:hypothetical protein
MQGAGPVSPARPAVWLEWGRARVLSDVLDRARLDRLAAIHPLLLVATGGTAARLNAEERDRRSPSYGVLVPPAGGST